MSNRRLFTGRSYRLNGTVEEASEEPRQSIGGRSDTDRDGVTSNSFGIQCADGSLLQMTGMSFPDGYFDDERRRDSRRSRRNGSN